MQISQIALQQTVIMFIYMAMGFVLARIGFINESGSRAISNILLLLVIPCMVIDSVCVECTPESRRNFLISLAVGVFALAFSLLIAALFFRRDPENLFAAGFCNCGFFGIPLVKAVIGDYASFYLVGLLIVFNAVQWVIGPDIMTGKRQHHSLTGLLKGPMVWSALIAVVLFYTGAGVRLPAVISTPLHAMSNMTAPLSMMVSGIFLSTVDLRSLFFSARLYRLSAVRLLLTPLLLAFIFRFLPVQDDIRMTLYIAHATASASTVSVYALKCGCDSGYAGKAVALTTLLSILTLPLMAAVGSWIM